MPDEVPTALEGALPFVYESTGAETHFTNTLDPDAASREVFSFHQPKTLAGWLEQIRAHPTAPTLRHRLRGLPELTPTGLWPAQFTAIQNLEVSLAANRPRALIQMATGSGKTFTAANIAYRLVKHADARRILFLVDRANLGRQTLKEFQGFSTPDDGRKFTELYNVQHLSSNRVDPVARVTISTIQRVYSILRGDTELDEELDEHSAFEVADELAPRRVRPRPPARVLRRRDRGRVPPLDLRPLAAGARLLRRLHDRAHRDAEQAGVRLLRPEPRHGVRPRAGGRGRRQRRLRRLPHPHGDHRARARRSTPACGRSSATVRRAARAGSSSTTSCPYTAAELDRKVVARDQIRTVLETFRDRLFTEIFPGRKEVPKTLIFAKDDAHAEEIVEIAREVFGKGNDFVAKITYKATGRKTDDLIAAFRNSPNPRIAVTVDMIATGTDVKPLECVFFMRAVKSRTYFEQMKGRGVRVISDTDLQAVVPGATSKERFVIVDAVGVTEGELSETPPLDRQPTVPLERLLRQVSFGVRDPDAISAIASRLARLDRRLTDTQRTQLAVLAGGKTVKEIAGGIVAALDPDRQLEAAREATGIGRAVRRRDRRRLEGAPRRGGRPARARARSSASGSSRPAAPSSRRSTRPRPTPCSRPATRRRRPTAPATRSSRGSASARSTTTRSPRCRSSTRSRTRGDSTFAEVRELADAIERPPHRFTPERLWEAYEALDRSRVRGSGQRVLTDLVSLVRVALHQESELVPYPELVRERFRAWLLAQENAGRVFTTEQLAWLEDIRDHVAASLGISADDFDYTPFREAGGLGKAAAVFGDDLGPLLDELNEVLVT